MPLRTSPYALLIIATGLGLPAAGQDQAPPPDKPAEQVYKNIQIFKGLPNSELMSAMFFMEGSLQVNCGHCHVWEDFSKDEKPSKRTARDMIRMVRQLNETQFQGRQLISCNTCHRGQSPPDAPLPFAEVSDAGTGKGDQALPPAEEVFRRHLQAVGGREAIGKIHSRVMKGTRFSSEGWNSAVEITREAPNKFKDTFKLQAVFANVFNGTRGWNQDNHSVRPLEGEDLARVKEDAEFYRDLKLGEMFPIARTAGKAKLNGKDSFVVEAKSVEGDRRQLYFDAATGLLGRIVWFEPSPFGVIPNAVEYADYRQVDGIQVAFTIRHLRPDYSLMDKITSIEQNGPIAANTFEKPVMAK